MELLLIEQTSEVFIDLGRTGCGKSLLFAQDEPMLKVIEDFPALAASPINPRRENAISIKEVLPQFRVL